VTGTSSHTEEKVVDSNQNPNDTVLARLYDGNGNYSQYDISDQVYDEIRDYYDYVRDNYDTNGLSIEIEKNSYVKHTTYDESNLAWHLIILGIMLYDEIMTLNMFDGYAGLFDYIRIKKILKTLRENKNDTKELEECTKELEEMVNDMMNMIDHNEELRKKFHELYKENEYLLSYPVLLTNKVDDSFKIYKVDRVKKLIKERE
jgi:hypothetical protein